MLLASTSSGQVGPTGASLGFPMFPVYFLLCSAATPTTSATRTILTNPLDDAGFRPTSRVPPLPDGTRSEDRRPHPTSDFLLRLRPRPIERPECGTIPSMPSQRARNHRRDRHELELTAVLAADTSRDVIAGGPLRVFAGQWRKRRDRETLRIRGSTVAGVVPRFPRRRCALTGVVPWR